MSKKNALTRAVMASMLLFNDDSCTLVDKDISDKILKANKGKKHHDSKFKKYKHKRNKKTGY